jgi:1,4-alpha-glucan branching enzyme
MLKILLITKPIKNSQGIQKRVGNRSDKKGAEFSCYAPEAMEVFVEGEFNGWDIQSLPMKRDKQVPER